MASFLKKRLSLKKVRKVSSMSSTTSTDSSQSYNSSSTNPSSTNPSVTQEKQRLDTAPEVETDDSEEEEEEESPEQQDESLVPDIFKNPLEEIATTAAGLGILFGCAITSLLFSKCKTAGIYIGALSLFHFLEFYVTAKYNPKKVHKESFIINNGSAYTLAHSFALFELFIEYIFFPGFKSSHHFIKFLGFILIVVGQIIRSLAMKTAGKSFSHLVMTRHESHHELVIDGVYSIFRHPSYFGFFWWAIGTQLVLLNPIGLVGFTYVLWSFFNERIGYEERFLVSFFGDRYVNYRDRTPVYIPFIN